MIEAKLQSDKASEEYRSDKIRAVCHLINSKSQVHTIAWDMYEDILRSLEKGSFKVINQAEIMQIQIYLYKQGALSLDSNVIDSFNLLKERIFEYKDLKQLPTYLLAMDTFGISPSEDETFFLQALIDRLLSANTYLHGMDQVQTVSLLNDFASSEHGEGPLIELKQYIKEK